MHTKVTRGVKTIQELAAHPWPNGVPVGLYLQLRGTEKPLSEWREKSLQEKIGYVALFLKTHNADPDAWETSTIVSRCWQIADSQSSNGSEYLSLARVIAKRLPSNEETLRRNSRLTVFLEDGILKIKKVFIGALAKDSKHFEELFAKPRSAEDKFFLPSTKTSTFYSLLTAMYHQIPSQLEANLELIKLGYPLQLAPVASLVFIAHHFKICDSASFKELVKLSEIISQNERLPKVLKQYYGEFLAYAFLTQQAFHSNKPVESVDDAKKALKIIRSLKPVRLLIEDQNGRVGEIFTQEGMIELLSCCPKLKKFIFSVTHFQQKMNLEILLHLRFKKIETLDLTGCNHLDEKILSLVLTSSLLHLNLKNCTQLTDKFIYLISKKATQLETLVLGGCLNLSDQAILAIANMQLSRLDVSDCHRLTDQSAERILKMPYLQDLNIEGCQAISDRLTIEAGLRFHHFNAVASQIFH